MRGWEEAAGREPLHYGEARPGTAAGMRARLFMKERPVLTENSAFPRADFAPTPPPPGGIWQWASLYVGEGGRGGAGTLQGTLQSHHK